MLKAAHMRARNLLLVLIAVLAAFCATQQSAKSAAAPAAGRPLVFTDLPAFDRDLAQTLSRAKSPVVVVSADHITLKQFPPRLER